MAILILIIGFVIVVAVPRFFISDRHNFPDTSCINNMMQINGAINEWALEQGKTNGTVIVENEVQPFLKLNVKDNLPKCPSGGKYTYGKVGDIPQITCSLSTATPPHKLH